MPTAKIGQPAHASRLTWSLLFAFALANIFASYAKNITLGIYGSLISNTLEFDLRNLVKIIYCENAFFHTHNDTFHK